MPPSHRPSANVRLAALVTDYRPGTHADVLLSKFLHGFACDEPEVHVPRTSIVSLYIDQFPPGEIGRAVAQRHGIPVYNSIQAAITLGDSRYYDDHSEGNHGTGTVAGAPHAFKEPSGGPPANGALHLAPQLAVDGVLIIAEHGDWPWNEEGARIHPRKAWLEQVCAVFAQSGRSCPVFNDKHLAPSWSEAQWMVQRCRDVGAPFMAGSSIPGTWREPFLEHPAGVDLMEAALVFNGGLDIYGAHALETLQAFVERRGVAASETGVAAIQCIQGAQVWEAGRSGRFSLELLVAACNATRESPIEVDNLELTTFPDSAPATAFLIEYRDGLRAAVFCLNAAVRGFGYAARVGCSPSPPRIESCRCKTVGGLRTEPGDSGLYSGYYHGTARGTFAHFSYLARNIEEMMITGVPSTPVERTLLATGMLEAALISHREGGRRIVTKWLDVPYQRRQDLPPWFPRSSDPAGAALLPFPPGGATL